MRPIVGMMRGTSRERYITDAEAEGVDGGHEAGAEQEGPVVDGDQCVGAVASPSRAVGAGEVLAEGVDGQHADDADEDHRGLEDAGGDEADGAVRAVPLGNGVQRDGGADAR